MELKHHPDKVGRGDLVKLPPASIKIDSSHNIRDMSSSRTREHIDELKISIKAWGGIKDPIEVRIVGNDAFVTDGECRLTAVMELIRDEGFECHGIQCIKEAAGTDVKERILNFGVSGTKERYSPLEMGEWCRRALRAGASEEEIRAAAGWKSAASVKHHLDMLSEMPEPVKEMVRDNQVSATTALRVSKNCDPDQAADFLKANREENRRLGVGAKNNFKVTAKTIKRDREKAEPQAEPTPVSGVIVVSYEQSPTPETMRHPVPEGATLPDYDETAPATPESNPEALDNFRDLAEALATTVQNSPEGRAAQRQSVKDLIEALEPFANLAHEQNFDERGDHDLIEVPFHYLKKAWIIFAKATGTANV